MTFGVRAAVVVGIFAVAGVAMFVAGRGAEGQGTLPDYTVATNDARAPSARIELHGAPDAGFEITARPAADLTDAGRLVAYVFAIGEGEPNPVDAKVEVAADGGVRIRGQARALDGAREVRVVLGRASESIKRFEDALSRAREGKSDAQVRVLVIPIVR